MLANDARVADLLVAERELVVREADRAGVVRELGMLERARVQRDGARLFAARERDATVQPPRVRQARVRDLSRKGVGRPAKAEAAWVRSS